MLRGRVPYGGPVNTEHVWGPNDADPDDARRVAGAAFDVAERVRDRPVVVAIDGRAGSGKSSLAQLVAPLLGNAPVVHMDDLYPGWDGLAAGVEILDHDVLAPLRSGRTGRYRRYDWHAGAPAGTHEVPAARFVLVEGCGCTAGDASGLVDVRVWVDAPEADRRRRGESRTEGGFDGHWDRWARQEDTLFPPDAAERADVVVRTG